MKSVVCTLCGSTGKPKSAMKGGILIEIVLWCFLLVPGLVYSLWRHTTRHNICRTCGSAHVVPVDSPVGRKLVS